VVEVEKIIEGRRKWMGVGTLNNTDRLRDVGRNRLKMEGPVLRLGSNKRVINLM